MTVTGNNTELVKGVAVDVTGSSSNNFTASALPGPITGGSFIATRSGSGTSTYSVGVYSKIQSAGGGTTTTGFGILIDAASAPASVITNNVGLAIAGQTAGTNNTNLLIGTTTPPTGNYAIYSSSAN